MGKIELIDLLGQCNVAEPHNSAILRKFADLRGLCQALDKFSENSYESLDIFQNESDKLKNNTSMIVGLMLSRFKNIMKGQIAYLPSPR